MFILPLGVLEAYEPLHSALRNTAYEDDDGIETVGSISKKSIQQRGVRPRTAFRYVFSFLFLDISTQKINRCDTKRGGTARIGIK